MTKEEAITILGNGEWWEIISGVLPHNDAERMELQEAVHVAISALRAQVDTPPNDPLTLDELREMDGEAVYFQFGDGAQGWAIVEIEVYGIVLYGPDFDDHAYPDGDFINMEYNGGNRRQSQIIDPDGHFGLHVLGWRAYRRKPEEEIL